MNKMNQLTVTPTYNVLPGTEVRADGVVFSTVVRDCSECGLQLFSIPDGEFVQIPFTNAHRVGSLYSVLIGGIDPASVAYRYYRSIPDSMKKKHKEEGEALQDSYVTFLDPYARELISVKTKDGVVSACRLFPYDEQRLAPDATQGTIRWNDELIYVCHAKGFTASKTSKAPHRGTFLGVADKIPYLLSLGVTAVELLPIYELRPNEKHPQGEANYWGFGEGFYFAPKRAYAQAPKAGKKSVPVSPQKEFSKLVSALHEAGIKLFLQLHFTENVSIQTQLETARFYVTHYHVDGFHIKGNVPSLSTIASDPILSSTAIMYYSFPYDELQKEDAENPVIGIPSVDHLCEYTENFQYLVRRFVKSDNNVIRDFAKSFVEVPAGHGRVHYVTNYDGFTLNDLVTYNWKHNEANGEDGRDGTDNNLSWNCGIEGKTGKKDVKALRLRQMKNFMALNLLAQGTPVLTAGDERANTQEGNNNPYNQDNETSWISWKDNALSDNLLQFTTALTALRRDHEVFHMQTPFRMNDYKTTGYPDLSFHGHDAWKPDFSGYSHTFGVMYDERYASTPSESLLYLAINMHWHSQMLGLPTPPDGHRWEYVFDTFEEDSFSVTGKRPEDQRHISVKARSICLLKAAPIVNTSTPPTAVVAPKSYFEG